MTESDELKTMKCPWCGEDDFDLVGLKTHLTNLDCESFNRCRRAPRYFKDVSERPVDIEDLVLYRDVQAIEQERDAIKAKLEHADTRIRRLETCVEDFLELTEVPDANCSCHLNPPCGDCVEYSGIRDVRKRANVLLKERGV